MQCSAQATSARLVCDEENLRLLRAAAFMGRTTAVCGHLCSSSCSTLAKSSDCVTRASASFIRCCVALVCPRAVSRALRASTDRGRLATAFLVKVLGE